MRLDKTKYYFRNYIKHQLLNLTKYNQKNRYTAFKHLLNNRTLTLFKNNIF